MQKSSTPYPETLLKVDQKGAASIPGLVAFSLFSSLFLVLLGPFDVYLNNSDEFSSTPGELISMLSMMTGVLFVLALALVLLSPRRLKPLFVRGLACVVLSSWVLSNFLYGDYGRLDGKQLVIDTWSRLSFVQTAALLLIIFLIVKLRIASVIKLTGAVFFITLLSGVIGILSQETRNTQPSGTEFPSTLTQFSANKNVLHVLLDELQSDLFLLAIESDSELKAAFDGFTFFSDTLAVYPSTEMSISVLMTGEVYRNNEPKRAFIKNLRSSKTGIQQLKTQGYELDAHTSCYLGVVERCSKLDASLLDEDVSDIEALQLLDIYIFKSVPDYLKSAVYNHEQWLLLGISNHTSYLKFPSGIAHLLFKQYVENITVSKNDSPRYKFFHSLVTHSPARLDADCNILFQRKPSLTGVEFIKCGLGHFADLLSKLKELGIYDQTMIILSSDHGSGLINNSADFDGFLAQGIDMVMLSQASATLAIKPFNARGTIETTQAPVSLRDIPATILAANGLAQNVDSKDSFEAQNVFSVSPTAEREREFLYYKWAHEYWKEEVLPPITTLRINGRIKDPQSWPTFEPTVRPAD
jgi:hypothetical protein